MSVAGITAASFLALTVGLYGLCRKIHRRWPYTLLSPMLTCLVATLLVLALCHIPYATYMSGAHWLTALLQPATVAFAVPLYRHRHALLRHAPTIALALLVGSVTAICTSFGLAKVVHLGQTVAISMAPRSITTPIAIQIAQTIGGNPVLTATFVICTGILGSILGPWLIRILRIQSPLGRGILFGMGAHGIGTSKAFEFGSEEGTFSTLAMVLAALLGVLAAPLLLRLWM
ncbi:MAG: LrgB family protein [Alicyclobacillus herbarius]|nr:LrgB family protein [Alicyclobacillus herbarius]